MHISSDNELKPCPFCGGSVQTVRAFAEYGITSIYCHRCKGHFKWNIEMEANETYDSNFKQWMLKWNGRDGNDASNL